ncbi:MAG TPA: FAD-dependent oxidoreductase [Candidatus Desulfaltia sp.]|nr:FAD-dependent oxidoreductase [Candidatus Desulfaltia sp.]
MSSKPQQPFDVLIIGGGPAGLTAALYAARARLRTKILTGPTPGGQIALTYRVENYPGLHEPLTGPELVERLMTHAKGFGAEIDRREAKAVDFTSKPLRVDVGDETLEARMVIVATGSRNRKLGLAAEDRLMGRGVFVCATCDAALYEGLRVVVVGGGDSALQEALDLSKFAEEVIVVHRGDSFTACSCLQAGAEEESRIRFMMNTLVEDILGEKYVEAVRLRSTETGEVTTMQTDGVLVAIGWDPNTALFKGHLELDPQGYIVSEGVKTGRPGVFVAGDINDRTYRQVVTACASGCMAALEAEWHLTRRV